MGQNGEFLRSQPWRNTFGVPGPYEESYAPHEGLNYGPFGHSLQFPGSDGHAPQFAPYSQQDGSYPMSGPALYFGVFPGFTIPGPWHVQPGLPTPPYAWYRPTAGAYQQGARLPFSDNHNPALGWHPAYLWNADQRPQQYTHQHHEPSPKPRHHGHRPPLWTRSPQTEKQNDHRRRRSLDSAGKRATTLPATPKQTQRRHESKSPFKKVLRSAGRLSRGILVTPGRIRAQVARPPSRAQDESSGGEAVEGEEDVAEASYGSDDDGRALVTWSLENLTLGVLDGERGSRDVGRLWMQRGDSRSGSSPTCNVRDKTCSTGIWQQPDRRDFSPPNGGDQQQPRPDSRPGPGSRRPATGRRDTGKGTSLDSDMSDLEGYRQISRMNGLLDIWDAKDNPQWEEQTFALCNLGRCKRCGRFYAPMGTVAHRCRMVTSMGRHY